MNTARVPGIVYNSGDPKPTVCIKSGRQSGHSLDLTGMSSCRRGKWRLPNDSTTVHQTVTLTIVVHNSIVQGTPIVPNN